MKLNNQGWGLGVFFGFVIVLLLCIFAAGVNAYKLGLTRESHDHYFQSDLSTTPQPTSNETIKDDEQGSDSMNRFVEVRQSVIQAAGLYRSKFHKDMKDGDEVVVSFNSLIDHECMAKLDDCTGYVKIGIVNGNFQYIPFFHCLDYVSDGYQNELDEK